MWCPSDSHLVFFSASNAGALPVAISKDQRFRAWSEAKLWKHQDINLSSFNSWCCTKCATNNFIYQKEEIYLQTKTTLQPSLHLFGGIAFLRKAGIGTHSSPPSSWPKKLDLKCQDWKCYCRRPSCLDEKSDHCIFLGPFIPSIQKNVYGSRVPRWSRDRIFIYTLW